MQRSRRFGRRSARAGRATFPFTPFVSQGCKPIGEPLTVTQAERNVLLKLGSRPAYDVLSDVYKDLSDAEREQARRVISSPAWR